MGPLMKGSSWSSCRKRKRPFASSIRFGCSGLNACSGGMGIFFQGWAAAAGWAGLAGLAAVVCAPLPETEKKVRRAIAAINDLLSVIGVLSVFISRLRHSVRTAL